jgi:CheY-like chemotaxis protein
MTEVTGRRVVEILLVEDDEGDVLITREAFQHYRIRNALHVVNDGDRALQFMRNKGEYSTAPRPDLVLLDLNLPRRNGHEVLAEVKSDPDLRVIPVVVLTTSQADEDILRSYSLHANAYVSKPVEADNFMSVVRQIDNFFGSIAELPRLRKVTG